MLSNSFESWATCEKKLDSTFYVQHFDAMAWRAGWKPSVTDTPQHTQPYM